MSLNGADTNPAATDALQQSAVTDPDRFDVTSGNRIFGHFKHRMSESLFGQPNEPLGPIQVSLDIFFGQDHLDLVIARIASILSFDDPVMEFPK